MDRIIRHITDKLVKLLPDDHQHYELEDLRHWGFPSFIVRRIRIELERNLAESMQLPRTDWANTDSEAIKNVWQQFINAIRAEARLPASYARTVIETAVSDVIEMLVQPRKNLSKVIFGPEKELSFEELQQRMEAVVVYRHFATLIPRYMKKKELDTLSRERCQKVIVSADEKITARYSPLNWAQMLEPLFSLLDDEIDTELLRLFFEDKNMNRIARQFDLMDTSVNRAGLIEVLSSPDSLNMEGYEKDQPELFEAQSDPASHSGEKERPGPSASPAQDAGEESDSARAEAAEADDINQEGSGDDSGLEQRASAQPEIEPPSTELPGPSAEDEDVEEEGTLNTIFSGEYEEEPEEEGDLNRRFAEEDREPDEEHPETAESSGNHIEDAEDETTAEESEPGSTDQNGEPETPMWQRFMSRDDVEMFPEEEEDDLEEGFIDDPVIDLTEDTDDNGKEVEAMREFLKDDRSHFVEELFGGSERAYDEALQELAGMEEWTKASKYIHENVFKRNMVDMYSETAVDFTDRLHSHFLKKSKS